MGIFDSMYSSDNQGGGLLGLLQSLGPQQMGFPGLQSDQAQYGPQTIPSPPTQPMQAMQQMQTPSAPMQAPSAPMSAPQPQMTQQAAMGPAGAMQAPEPSLGDRLSAGFHSWAQTPVGSPMAALSNGIQGMTSGQASNPQKGLVDSMVLAGVPQAMAIAAGNSKNPEVQKFVLEKFGKQHYGFTTLPDGTVLRQDPTRGTAEPVYQGAIKPTFGVIAKNDGKEVYGWTDWSKRSDPTNGITPYKVPGSEDEDKAVTGPDGKLIPIPPGVDRKTFVNEISRANAKAAAGEMTETQAKSTIYANKMESSEAILKSLQGEGQSLLGRISEGNPWLPGSSTAGRYLQSDNYQKYKQAGSNFITALLRQESGAAIGESEFDRYSKEYLPQPGDGAQVLAQKAEARRVAIEGMKKGAGPSYKSASPPSSASQTHADPLGIR